MNKVINNGYCNGCFGRRYDLTGSEIESEGSDWIVIRTKEGEPLFASFEDSEEKEEYVKEWCSGF